MKRFILLFIIIFSQKGFSQNINWLATMSYGASKLSNLCGYVDTAGIEYALVGTDYGLDIVDVSNPANPVSKFTVPGNSSDWREIKTYRKVAYVATEGGGGLTVVDMSQLPDTVTYHYYEGDGAILGQLATIHALHCDTAKGFLYLYGTNLFQGSTMFFDLADPLNPVYAGGYVLNGDEYVHDGMVMNDTMYEGHIYGGQFTIVDVTNKSNPVLLAQQTTPTAFTHNTWLSDDHRTLFTTDENSNSYLTAYDISNPANIEELSRFQAAAGSGAIVHNTHILNDYAITSWYTEGVVITDVSRPRNPIEVGHFDTDLNASGNGFVGCWGVYPFLPSGTIVASDINLGLFVLSPTYIRGCYLEGIITDSVTSALLGNVSITLLATTATCTSDILGEYRTGTAVAGTYDIQLSKPGYYSKTVTGIILSNGVLTNVNVQLAPIPTFPFSGSVTDSITGTTIQNAVIILEGNNLTYTQTSDINGNFTFPGVIPGNYSMISGKWGYHTLCSNVTLVQGNPLSAELKQGYYDDFSLNFGWAVSGTTNNGWERGDPVGTYDGNNTEINPENDVQSDCGSDCFVTDNGGSPYNNHDVDDGYSLLVSPMFDLSNYTNPVVSYYRRFLDIDGLGNPNDEMIISITNLTDTIILEIVGPNDPGNGTWLSSVVPLTGLLTMNDSMYFMVRIADEDPGNICEGGLDLFQVDGQINIGMNEIATDISLHAYPNPFNNSITISYELAKYDDAAELFVRDIEGRIIERISLQNKFGKVSLGSGLSQGIYFVELISEHGRLTQRIIKN